jgi:hypothetical protein
VITLCALLLMVPRQNANSAVIAQEARLWKKGDMWQIDIEWIPVGKAKAGKTAKLKFDHLASVAKDATVAGKDCWQLALIPDGDLPDGTDIVIHAYIEKKTGWPLKVVELDGEFEAKLIPFGDKHVIAPPLEFFPVELFAVVEPGETTAGVNKIVITNEKSPGKTKVGLALFENDVEQWRIEQIWKDGALFWDSYEKFLKGRLAFKATAKVFQLAKRTDAEKTVEQKEAEAAKAEAAKAVAEKIVKAEKAWADFAKYHPLGLDKKLHKQLTVVEMRPKLRDLLARLDAASGLKFTLADSVAHHEPDLGSFQLEETRVYSFMEIIAERGIDNGRWEKIDGGYRLTGTSRTPLPPSRFRWAWLALPLALALAASGAFILYRRRGKKTAATSPNA